MKSIAVEHVGKSYSHVLASDGWSTHTPQTYTQLLHAGTAVPALLRTHIASTLGTVYPHNDTGDAEDKQVTTRVFERGALHQHVGASAVIRLRCLSTLLSSSGQGYLARWYVDIA